MKRKIAVIVLFAVAMLALSGCQCRHEWTEADCGTPKTCTKCGETEGEALGHDWQEATCAAPKTCARCGKTEGNALAHSWKEANYQDPKTCTLCGATEGEPLTPSFVEHGLPEEPQRISSLRKGAPIKYVVSCSGDTPYKTSGSLRFSNYRVFESDETHEEKAGYEWRAIHCLIECSGYNAKTYGVQFSVWANDYYTLTDFETDEVYTINHHGVDYRECIVSLEGTSEVWVDDTYHYSVDIYFRTPVGYDGMILSFCSQSFGDNDLELYDMVDENTLFFRMD